MVEEEKVSWPLSDHKLLKSDLIFQIEKEIKPKLVKLIPNKLLPFKLKEFICLESKMDLCQLSKIYKINKKLAKKAIYKCKERPENLLKALDILRETEDPKQMVRFY